MTLDEARDICAQITRTAHHRSSAFRPLGDDPGLPDIPLEKMLEANRLVSDGPNLRNEEGNELLAVHCDDRLTAALYVIENYEADSRAIVIFNGFGLAVLPMEPA